MPGRGHHSWTRPPCRNKTTTPGYWNAGPETSTKERYAGRRLPCWATVSHLVLGQEKLPVRHPMLLRTLPPISRPSLLPMLLLLQVPSSHRSQHKICSMLDGIPRAGVEPCLACPGIAATATRGLLLH
eukprot:g46134.t1